MYCILTMQHNIIRDYNKITHADEYIRNSIIVSTTQYYSPRENVNIATVRVVLDGYLFLN